MRGDDRRDSGLAEIFYLVRQYPFIVSNILSIQSITKFYGKIRALNQVSFDVPPGSVFGVLGPNGSGKTTLLGIVMDVLKASGGSYSWFGEPPSEQQRQKIGTCWKPPISITIYPASRICGSLRLSKARERGTFPVCSRW